MILLAFAAAHFSCETRLNKTLAKTLMPVSARPREAPAVAWVVDEIDGRRITYQIGFVAGYSSYVGLDVERRTAVVVLQNSLNWTDKVGQKLLVRMALAQEIRERMLRPRALAASPLSSR